MRLNDGWAFVRTDLGSVWEALRPIANADAPENVPFWTNVTLPHTWNACDAVAPDVHYYEGAGWYRKMLKISNPYESGRTVLHFEGAGQKTDIYVYTEKVASHVGGYDEWTADITDAVERFLQSNDSKRFNGFIPLVIRCDNSRDAEMIPSDLSDFTIYGGIYRYLNLVYTPAISLSNIYVDAQVDVKGKRGTVSLHLTPSYKGSDFLINLQILDPKNKIIIEKKGLPVNSATTNTFEVTSPQLWSPENPNLYTLQISLLSPSKENDAVSSQSEGFVPMDRGDTYNEKFGFRTFEFREKGAFYLNGERLLLRGTHRHEDHAGVGAAMTEEQMRDEMKMIKAMGANFIRLGHYQQSRITLDLCDSLGLLVWEEIPWCRGGLGGEQYRHQALRMLENMIIQHRNHPSVILWGLGNENDWKNDFPAFSQDSIRRFMSELNEAAHKFDPSRLTSIRRCDFCSDIIDVYSPSIWAGWYTGIYEEYKERTEAAQERYPRFFHAEWGGDSHAGRFEENPFVPGYDGNRRIKTAANAGDWSENYICDLFDWHLKEQETMPALTGSAFWTFKDFATPIRPGNPVPYVNQKGVVERDLTPKESYYVFQSYWSKEPMIRIFGHAWKERWGNADEEKQLKVYSNCREVELFLNGKSLGVKKRSSRDFPASGLRWETKFQAGNNTVKAIGKTDGRQFEDEINFFYETRKFAKPSRIELAITEKTDTYVWIEATLKDVNGITALDGKDFIYFGSAGDGELVCNQGTSAGSSKVQARNGRARIRLLKKEGKTTVAVKSDGLKTAFIEIE
jgi:beta-galactosidase